MGWNPKPFNPLSHTSLKTTLIKYAEHGADDELAARHRCIKKYYWTHKND